MPCPTFAGPARVLLALLLVAAAVALLPPRLATADELPAPASGVWPLAMATSQMGIGGASFIPDDTRKGAADALRKLGANQ